MVNLRGLGIISRMDQLMRKIIHYLLIHVMVLGVHFPGDKEVMKGVELFYNYQTAEAVEILAQARKNFPENPRAHFTWAAARMLDSEAHKPVIESYEILEGDLNEIIPILKYLSDSHSDVPEYDLYLGSAIGLKARINLGKKEWVSTLVNAYRGFQIIRRIEREYPDLMDAKLPIGIVEYFSGLNPGLVQWTAKLIGLEATRQAGLEKIELAVSEGEFANVEAKKIITFLSLWVENDIKTALRHSDDLHRDFPKNYFFTIMYLESMIKSGEKDGVLNLVSKLERELEFLTPIQREWYKSYLDYEKSQYYFHNSEFEKALHYVDLSIDEYHAELDIILSHALLLKGKLYDIKHEREKAIFLYKKCVKLDNYSSAIDEATTYLKHRYK